MQVVIVGAACPSLLNQLVMRILIPSVLPGVGRIGQESRGPNDHHTVNARQMQEAHAERSKKGMTDNWDGKDKRKKKAADMWCVGEVPTPSPLVIILTLA